MSYHFEQISKIQKSMKEIAYEAIKSAIIKGELLPGERLVETALANQMGISRGPIREAFRQLETEGLIYTHPYRSTVVNELDNEEVTMILIPVRKILENYVFTYAKDKLSEEDFETLDALLLEMETYCTSDDLDGVALTDFKIHHFVMEKCLSPGMLALWNTISGRIFARIMCQAIRHESFMRDLKYHRRYVDMLKYFTKHDDPEQIKDYLDQHIT